MQNLPAGLAGELSLAATSEGQSYWDEYVHGITPGEHWADAWRAIHDSKKLQALDPQQQEIAFAICLESYEHAIGSWERWS